MRKNDLPARHRTDVRSRRPSLRLDAPSTEGAGIEKLFFSDLDVIPPLVFMEEAEKADPEALKVWLGALDDRGEIPEG